MVFTSVCLITEDVPRLVHFYEQVLGCPSRGDAIHAVVLTQGCALSIYSRQAAQNDMGFVFAPSHGAGKVTLSFLADDVDGEYQRLKELDVLFECLPTTYPWGNRALHFRDPDGNIVGFYCPLAQKRP